MFKQFMASVNNLTKLRVMRGKTYKFHIPQTSIPSGLKYKQNVNCIQRRTWPYKTSVAQFFSQVVLYIISHNIINEIIV